MTWFPPGTRTSGPAALPRRGGAILCLLGRSGLASVYRTPRFGGTVDLPTRPYAEETQVAKKKKLPLVYQPVGFVLGAVSAALAGRAFRATWTALRHEEDAPDPLDRDRGWGEILLAAALHGAVFAVARSAADRTGAKAIERSTGVWPVKDKGDRD